MSEEQRQSSKLWESGSFDACKNAAAPTIAIVMGCLGHGQFLFYFILFSDFIGILFSFSFLLDDEEARDIAVT